MTDPLLEQIGSKLMLAFEGLEPPARLLSWLTQHQVGGFTLFRGLNVESPAQVRALTAALQTTVAPANHPPLLIAADQEGGQLVALGEASTQFPGNMALGATGDTELAEQVGAAMGRELAAVGVNVNYAPVCDVNTNPKNPNVGVRAFSDDPALVARMAAAMVRGMQAAGVAATAKHFPGNGDSGLDPHYDLPVLAHEVERLERVELRPFRAAIEAGVRLMMTAHVGVPALTGKADLPATLARSVMHTLLRREMGFEGLLISDALDMKAISQGAGQIIDVIAAVRAGVDLLLLTADREVQDHIYTGLQQAYNRGLIKPHHLRDSATRILSLKQWVWRQQQPQLSLIGCAEHRWLEKEVARRSVTLVRDEAGLLPLRLPAKTRVAVIMPRPQDLTPADTSAYVGPMLAQAVRVFHTRVDEFVTGHVPAEAEVAALKEKVTDYDLLLLGTVSASMQPAQAAMVKELLQTRVPVITVALRTPYDLVAYPQAGTYICTYGLQPAAMEALAAGLFGEIPFRGRLPVDIPGLYTRGHGLSAENEPIINCG